MEHWLKIGLSVIFNALKTLLIIKTETNDLHKLNFAVLK